MVTNRLVSTLSYSSKEKALYHFLFQYRIGIFTECLFQLHQNSVTFFKNFNHRKLSQILKYFRKQFHISYISLGIEVSLMLLASLILCSSLLYIYIC